MSLLSILIGALGGAGLMFLLDPQQGRRRRALLRDQVVKVSNRTGDRADDLAHDIQNRAHGLTVEMKNRMDQTPVDDETLAARARSALGRFVSHPGAVKVHARDGRVT